MNKIFFHKHLIHYFSILLTYLTFIRTYIVLYYILLLNPLFNVVVSLLTYPYFKNNNFVHIPTNISKQYFIHLTLSVNCCFHIYKSSFLIYHKRQHYIKCLLSVIFSCFPLGNVYTIFFRLNTGFTSCIIL